MKIRLRVLDVELVTILVLVRSTSVRTLLATNLFPVADINNVIKRWFRNLVSNVVRGKVTLSNRADELVRVNTLDLQRVTHCLDVNLRDKPFVNRVLKESLTCAINDTTSKRLLKSLSVPRLSDIGRTVRKPFRHVRVDLIHHPVRFSVRLVITLRHCVLTVLDELT